VSTFFATEIHFTGVAVKAVNAADLDRTIYVITAGTSLSFIGYDDTTGDTSGARVTSVGATIVLPTDQELWAYGDNGVVMALFVGGTPS
jgi:hypothetical protein